MKVAFVVGFYNPVKLHLDKNYSERLAEGSIIWIAENRGVKSDLEKFKELFFGILASKQPREVLVLIGQPSNHDWITLHIEGIVAQGSARFPASLIGLEVLRDLGAFAAIDQQIQRLRLHERDEISAKILNVKLEGGRAICIQATGRTSIKDALKRGGFSEGLIEEFFDEEVIQIGQNSTLNERLQKYAKGYFCMLYAWDGLRHASSGLVGAFRKRKGKFIDAESAAKVVERLRTWLLS